VSIYYFPLGVCVCVCVCVYLGHPVSFVSARRIRIEGEGWSISRVKGQVRSVGSEAKSPTEPIPHEKLIADDILNTFLLSDKYVIASRTKDAGFIIFM